MKQFEEQKFNIPELKGISAKTVEEHLKLYAGYVKNANSILEKIPEYEGYAKEDAFAPYVVAELHRRFAFEFDGMRNHEYYFTSFEGGVTAVTDGALKKAIEKEFGSFDGWLSRFKTLAKTRGIGWAMLCYDKKTDRLLNAWVDEQHLGHLTGLSPVLALDMWEHSFVADYQPSGKKQYIEDFFSNLNWSVIEENFRKTNS
ncbi:MAG: Fe-Mn family superoxide dismutase [Candidatus Taylorbacteria bacterium]|nr:Fe-Mn family superoxide dismutase [Candidatus Taylorbacteria bacterium]